MAERRQRSTPSRSFDEVMGAKPVTELRARMLGVSKILYRTLSGPTLAKALGNLLDVVEAVEYDS